jgi:hypothetical protein
MIMIGLFLDILHPKPEFMLACIRLQSCSGNEVVTLCSDHTESAVEATEDFSDNSHPKLLNESLDAPKPECAQLKQSVNSDFGESCTPTENTQLSEESSDQPLDSSSEQSSCVG